MAGDAAARPPGKELTTQRRGRRKSGDKSLISEERIRAIVAAVTAGCPKWVAAKTANIHPDTLQNWLRIGGNAWDKVKPNEDAVKPDDRLYVALFRSLEKAEADAIQRNVLLIQTAGKKNWQAAAWWLERRFPASFAQNRLELKEMKRQITEMMLRLAEQDAAAAEKAKREEAKREEAEREKAASTPPPATP